MRIAHVNSDPGTGPRREKGAAVHVAEMRRAFAALGAEVLALDGLEPAALRARLDGQGAAGLDLVYERYALESGPAASWARDRGVPYAVEVNAPLEDEDALHRAGRRSVGRTSEGERRALLAAADLVLAVSEEVAEHARARGARPGRVVVEPNAVDPERFAPRTGETPLRRALVPAGRFALGFHGRLRPWHNLELLFDATDLLLVRGVEVQLVLIGAGDFAGPLGGRPAARRATLRPWVPHAEVGAHVACFDALPLTYAPDRPFYFSPLKLQEAMAAGVVPLVPRMGALPAHAEDGVQALHYRAGDAGALADAVGRLARDQELRARLASAARARALEHTWVDVARRVLERTLGGVLG